MWPYVAPLSSTPPPQESLRTDIFGPQVICGILFSMTEMVTLANSTHQIPRLRTGFLVIIDLVLCALGMVSFFYFMISSRWRPEQGAAWSLHDPHRDEKAIWAPWYAWLQLAAALLHFLYMIMHCIDACRQSSRDRRRRRERRRQSQRVQWGY